MTGFRANFIGVTMYDETKMRRMNVEELVKYAEPEPSDPQQRFLDELEISLCPSDEREFALKDVQVSMQTEVECQLDMLVGEMNGWIL
jgi:hypothetical protein